jgi:hypothetical protein
MLLPRFSDIRYDYSLAGGATIDLGCYAVYSVRMFGGSTPELSARNFVDVHDFSVDLVLRVLSIAPSAYHAGAKVRIEPSRPRAMAPCRICSSTVSAAGHRLCLPAGSADGAGRHNQSRIGESQATVGSFSEPEACHPVYQIPGSWSRAKNGRM